MDPFVALLLFPPVACVAYFGCRLGAELVENQVEHRHQLRLLDKKCEANAHSAASAIQALMKAKTDAEKSRELLERHIGDMESYRAHIASLEQQVASIKTQLQLAPRR
jgi:predicted  nucleic acid-binding Zn-ribbon protein